MANSLDTRFTLMAFPQALDAAGKLTLHILFIPRNFNPLKPVNTVFGTGNIAPAFADQRPVFEVKVVNNPDEFPGKVATNERAVATTISYSDLVRPIYEKLKDAKNEDGTPKYFDIEESRSGDQAGQSAEHRAPAAVDAASSVKKYLPETYRKAFNFTSPRHRNAVTDDSYHCAMRDNRDPVPVPKSDKISWGKVYAHLLRQPLLAEKAGLLYKTTIQLQADDFKLGGWLYLDVPNATVYGAEQQQSVTLGGDLFIKRYAARIPALKKDGDGFVPRSLFAAVLFPVVKAGDTPDGIFDELYLESADYNDGFAKIVHANQPVSGNLLAEEQDGFHPQKEVGIRLGWDDEQILVWYLRQLAKDPSVNGGTDRLDAPLGVMGYHIDVRELDNEEDLPEEDKVWESLTAVQSNHEMVLEDDQAPGTELTIGSYQGELPFQVYPVKLYGLADSNYWLPMYFCNWNDHSLVIPDKIAAEIYRNSEAIQKLDTGTENRNVKITDTYSALSVTTKLRYSKSYAFRVRLSDLTGGGPAVNQHPEKKSLSNEAQVRFKRYIAPYALQIINKDQIKDSTDELNFEGDTLIMKRPLMGYPSVVYTGKYTDPISLLKQSVEAQIALYTPANPVNIYLGLADPDVSRIAIKVEIETLQMDNLASDSGKDNYITLYQTFRNFDPVNFEEELPLRFQYKDYSVLHLQDLPLHPFGTAADDATISNDSGELILPTNRNIRVTFRAVGFGNEDYWGNSHTDPALDSRYGKPTLLNMRRDSRSEPALFGATDAPRLIQGIYLQPDPQRVYTGKTTSKQTLPTADGLPDIVERLAKELEVNCNQMTLTAEKGARLQFWCSNQVRHTLSPDNSSITFAGKQELVHHWLVVSTLTINRDWTWDGLETLSFVVERSKDSLPYTQIGMMELRRIAPFQAIQEGSDGLVHREQTKLIFIDVIDQLPAAGQSLQTSLLKYKIIPRYKAGIVPEKAFFETRELLLPTTINPHQVPKVIGSGIALSPYVKNEKYSLTEARKRFLWLEFDQAPDDARNALFARQLGYAPDQLLSNNHPSLYEIATEAPFPVDPEYTRIITPDTAHEHAGLKAMQRMEKSIDTNRHFYLLPLPEGLHSESAELFGFFTYEFRFGHTDQLWSTAQGRFGRPYRLTGLQHPAPNLLCTVNRDDKTLRVNAPYAMAVSDGKNVTANPVRTAIWCLLYAQVKQADGKGYRNILLEEKKLIHQRTLRDQPTAHEQATPDTIAIARAKFNMQLALETEAVKYASGTWTNAAIAESLALYGLPDDSPLSVLCVEVFGYIRNIADHVSNLEEVKEQMTDSISLQLDKAAGKYMAQHLQKPVEASTDDGLPLSDQLGLYRILRTSPLTEVPFVCCTDSNTLTSWY